MARTAEQNKGIRDKKKEQIIEASMKLFVSKGYHGTSTSMIAKEAGVSKGLLYHYIESKEQLVREILLSAHTIQNKYFDMHRKGNLSPDEFEHFVRQWFKAIKENKEFYKTLYSIINIPEVAAIFRSEKRTIESLEKNAIWNYFKNNFENSQKEIGIYGIMIKGLADSYCTSKGRVTDDIAEEMLNRIIQMFKK